MYDKRYVSHFRCVQNGDQIDVVKASSVPKGKRNCFLPRGGYTLVTLVFNGEEFQAKYNTKAGQNFEKKRGVYTAEQRAKQLFLKKSPEYINELRAERQLRRKLDRLNKKIEVTNLDMVFENYGEKIFAGAANDQD